MNCLRNESNNIFRYALAICVIVINCFLRITTRFLAAMSMRTLTIIHPVVIAVPVLITFISYTCFVSPACYLGSFLADFSLRWHCLAWKADRIAIPEICFGVLWLIIYTNWAYKEVRTPKSDITDDVLVLFNKCLLSILFSDIRIVRLLFFYSQFFPGFGNKEKNMNWKWK